MDVSKSRGTPKWMFIMETPIKKDDLGGFPIIFWKHPYGVELPIRCGDLVISNPPDFSTKIQPRKFPLVGNGVSTTD